MYVRRFQPTSQGVKLLCPPNPDRGSLFSHLRVLFTVPSEVRTHGAALKRCCAPLSYPSTRLYVCASRFLTVRPHHRDGRCRSCEAGAAWFGCGMRRVFSPLTIRCVVLAFSMNSSPTSSTVSSCKCAAQVMHSSRPWFIPKSPCRLVLNRCVQPAW